MINIRYRCPSGCGALALGATATLRTLQEDLAAKTDIPVPLQSLKIGFPPKPVATTDPEASLAAVDVESHTTIVVDRIPPALAAVTSSHDSVTPAPTLAPAAPDFASFVRALVMLQLPARAFAVCDSLLQTGGSEANNAELFGAQLLKWAATEEVRRTHDSSCAGVLSTATATLISHRMGPTYASALAAAFPRCHLRDADRDLRVLLAAVCTVCRAGAACSLARTLVAQGPVTAQPRTAAADDTLGMDLRWPMGYREHLLRWHDALQLDLPHPLMLGQAFTHRSTKGVCAGQGRDYERLEWHGDAILGMVVAFDLYTLSTEDKGRGGKGAQGIKRQYGELVSRRVLAQVGAALGVPRLVLHSLEGDRVSDRVVADVVEALLAVVYMQKGLQAAHRCVHDWMTLANTSYQGIAPEKKHQLLCSLGPSSGCHN